MSRILGVQVVVLTPTTAIVFIGCGHLQHFDASGL
jgi:hypothetical protein